jgi:hypothetical protein
MRLVLGLTSASVGVAAVGGAHNATRLKSSSAVASYGYSVPSLTLMIDALPVSPPVGGATLATLSRGTAKAAAQFGRWKRVEDKVGIQRRQDRGILHHAHFEISM